MSIVNFCLRADRVDVITDTLGYRRDPAGRGVPAGLCRRKASHNGRFAYAHRGPALFGNADASVFDQLTETSLDGLIELLSMRAMPDTAGTKRYAQYLFGFSEERRRMRAVEIVWEGDRPAVCEFLDGVHMIPRPPGSRPFSLPAVASPAQLFKMGLAQFRVPAAHAVAYCVGGVAHLTTVDEGGARQCIYGLFPDYEARLEEFGDPNAEAVSEWARSAAHDAAA